MLYSVIGPLHHVLEHILVSTFLGNVIDHVAMVVSSGALVRGQLFHERAVVMRERVVYETRAYVRTPEQWASREKPPTALDRIADRRRCTRLDAARGERASSRRIHFIPLAFSCVIVCLAIFTNKAKFLPPPPTSSSSPSTSLMYHFIRKCI